MSTQGDMTFKSVPIVNREGTAPDLKDLAGFYDKRFTGQYCKTHDGRHMRQLATMLKCVPATVSPSKVLDYGCGAGGCMTLLKDFFPDAEIHGIDISDEALKKANSRFSDCRFASFDGSKAPYPDGNFDVIFSSHVLEHVLDLGKCIEDIARMVRKGGYVCLTLPCANERSLEWKLTTLMKGGIIKSATGEEKWFWEDPSHLRRLTSSHLINAFSKQGLQLKEAIFGNQFWGGIEGVCNCGPGIILDWLHVLDGKGLRAKTMLFFAKATLLLISPVFLASVNLRQKAHCSRGIRKFLYLAAMPVKLVYWPLAKWLRSLADEEWEIERKKTSGASQFLVFQKAQ
ncbi:MAG: ubiE [Pedosphaera sp.]|nr:ubiE [Pedosphaera sp.]